MSDQFAAYKLPAGVTKGVEIPLPGTDAVFTVRLPSLMDEGLQLKIVSRVNMTDDGELDTVGLRIARQDVFFENCIIGAKGIPDGMTIEQFFEEYELAGREIFNEASERALKVDEEVRDALGNLKPTPNGKTSGQGKQTNTNKSLKVA